jgi:arylsulfatase A-like enzyme
MIFIFASLVGIILLLHWINTNLYRNLYEFIHTTISFIEACFCGFLVLFISYFYPFKLIKKRSAVVFSLAFISLGLGIITFFTFNKNQLVRFVSFERTTLERSLLLGIEAFKSWIRPQEVFSFKSSGDIYKREFFSSTNSYEFRVQDASLLLITIDALRADHVGIYGYSRKTTPNIDKFAKKSVLFERAYCQSPHSSYSIASIHAADYFRSTSKLGIDSYLTMADILSDQGYLTIALFTSGIFHTEKEMVKELADRRFGFRMGENRSLNARALTDRTIEFINSAQNKRFFLWVHYFDPHEPYIRHPQFDFGNGLMDRYDSEIAYTDQEIGRLLRYIEQEVSRPVIVAITADHGEEFREHGGLYHGSSLYDEQVRVPLIIFIPGVSPRRIKTPVALIDLAPTLLSLVGYEANYLMQGKDLIPLIFGKEKSQRPVFSEVSHKRMVLVWPWKLIWDHRYDIHELYNLIDDPKEKMNIYDRNKRKGEELKKRLYSWMDSLSVRKLEAQKGYHPTFMDLARLGDSRAAEPLFKIIKDRKATPSQRREAARLLRSLRNKNTASWLKKILHDKDPYVSGEAAIGLGMLYYKEAQGILLKNIYHEDISLRHPSAVALGRLKDKRAVPVLLEALQSPDLKFRKDVIRVLGPLKDSRAIEPLLQLWPELRTRALVILSLGLIGDKRIVPFLINVLDTETHAHIRGHIVIALGWLKDKRAIKPLLKILINEPEIKWTPESLIRLEAIRDNKILGIDFNPNNKTFTQAFRCYERPFFHPTKYLNRTWCEFSANQVSIKIKAPKKPYLIILRTKHKLKEKRTLKLLINGKELKKLTITHLWQEFRIPSKKEVWKSGTNHLTLKLLPSSKKSVIGLDHILLVPEEELRTDFN